MPTPNKICIQQFLTPEQLACSAPGIERELIGEAARYIQRQIDQLIATAITRRLGIEDWCPEQLRGRLNRVIRPDAPDVYTLDGAPLLEVYAPETITNDRLGRSIDVSFEYRMLAGD